MSSKSHVLVWGAVCALGLNACGGGGGGSSTPPPPPTPPPPDTTAPNTTLSSTPSARTNLAALPFTVTSNEAGATFEARTDGGAYAAVAATFTISGLADGPHTIDVRARDAAGNIDATPATFDVVIDTQAPDTTLMTSPWTSSPSTSGTFVFTSEANATFETSLDGAAYVAAASPLTLNGLSSGAHTLLIRAKDQAGNVDASPASFTWEVDIAAPVVTVSFPTRNSYTEASTLHVRGTATDVTAISVVSINGVPAATSDSYRHWTAVVPIQPGNNAISVSTTDVLGNTNANAARVDVANRGAAISSIDSLSWDPVRGRAIVADYERGAIIAIDGTTGIASVVSDAKRGVGPALSGGYFVAEMDSANDRILVMRGQSLLEINPDTGQRAEIPTAAPDSYTTFFGTSIACNANCSLLYMAQMNDPQQGQGIFSINPQTGARTLVTGGWPIVGSGYVIQSARGIAFDAVNSKIYVVDGALKGLFEVNPATADRTLISSMYAPGFGSGVDLIDPRGIVLDLARNRAIVTDTMQNQQARLVAIDLTTGARSVFATTSVDATLAPATDVFFDAAASRILVGMNRGSIAQVNIPSGEVRRFSDSNIGTGMNVWSWGALLFESGTRTLLNAALGAIVRIDPATNDRSVLVPTLLGGSFPYAPAHLGFDTRAGMPPGRMIGVGPGSSPNNFRAYDLTAGTDAEIVATPMWGISPVYPFDGPNGRMIGKVFSGGSTRIVSFDVLTGAQGATISDSAVGAVPFTDARAMAFDEPAGSSRRILVVDDAQVLAVDPATGVRTLISSSAAGAGPSLVPGDSISVNSAGRSALISSGASRALQWVNLANGNRTIASGSNPDDQTVKGAGPPIARTPTRVVADYPNDVAYVISNWDTLLAVDLVSGDRVITSR